MWSLGKGGRDRSGSHKQRGGTEMFSKMTVTFLTRELYAKRCFPLSHIFWGMTLAEGFPAARGFWDQKKFRHTIRSLCLLQIVVVPVKLSHFYTVYCRCASTSTATHLPCNNLNNSRNTSWGTLEKFSAVIYRRGLWAPEHLTLHKSKITGQLQHYPDVTLYHNKDQLKTTQRNKSQTHLLSRVRKQCRQYCSESINSVPAQPQVNQHSILGKYIPFWGWIWPPNTIQIHCAVRET